MHIRLPKSKEYDDQFEGAGIEMLAYDSSARRDVIVSVLEFHSDSPIQRSSFTPPWVGASLKDYILAHGAKGIAEVDDWIQTIRSA